MRKRSFILLLAVTVLAVAAAVYTVVLGQRNVSPPPPEHRAFPKLAAQLGDLAWMRLAHGKLTADFGAVGGRWAIVEKGNYPADQGKVRRLLLGLADLTLIEPKTKRPELFGRLGLDDPRLGKSTEIGLQDRTGATVARLVVGKSRPDQLGGGNGGVYVRKPGDDQTWLARGSLDLPGDLKEWLDRRIVDMPPGRIQSVTLTGADGTALVLRRDADSGGKFAVADPPPDTKFKDASALAAPAAALAGLELDDVAPAADLSIPQDGVATAAFATYDGLTLTVRLFDHDQHDWVALSAEGTGKTAQEVQELNARLARWVYAIPHDRAKLLRTKLADLTAPAKGS